MPAIEILRPGIFTAMSGERHTFAEEDLAAIAAAYNTDLHEAPIVVGHPKSNGPAYGWVKSLKFTGGRLVADAGDIDQDFADLVRAKRFKKVSASFYAADGAGNPTPGTKHLRHVGFLGAMPPAVKGLKECELSEDESCIEIEFGEREERTIGRLLRGLREYLIGDRDLETADRVLPAWEIERLEQAGSDSASMFAEDGRSPAAPHNPEEDDMTDKTKSGGSTDLSEREREIAAREAEQDKRDAEFAEQRKAEQSKVNGAFLDGLVKDGKLPQGLRPSVLSFMEKLDTETTLDFGEERDVPMTDAFQKLLGQLPAMVDFGEVAQGQPTVPAEIELSDAPELGKKAGELRRRLKSEGTEISTSEAVRRVRTGES
tara:strand:+ start:2913 stop:4031 length:1119 start_codon:yes stop_codon:yes gene_type:complete